jgi:hypothetical protein
MKKCPSISSRKQQLHQKKKKYIFKKLSEYLLASLILYYVCAVCISECICVKYISDSQGSSLTVSHSISFPRQHKKGQDAQ